MNTLFGGTWDWITTTEDRGTLSLWAGGLVAILVISFLWSTVIKQIVE